MLPAVVTSYLTTGLQGGSFLVTTPVIIAHYGAAGFGHWALAMAIIGYIQGIDLGVGMETSRASAAASSAEARGRAVVSALICLSVPASLAVVASVCLFVTNPSMGEGGPWIATALGLGGLSLPLSLASNILYGLNRQVARNLILFVAALLSVIGIVVASVCGADLAMLVVASSGGGIGAFIVMAVGILRMPAIARPPLRTIRASHVVEVLRSSLSLYALTAAGQIIIYSDTFIVDALFGAATLGVYTVGMRIVQAFSTLVNQLSDVLLPGFARAAADGVDDEVCGRVRRGIRIAACLAFALVGVLVALGRGLIILWVGPHYLAAWSIALLLCGGVLLNGPTRTAVIWAIAVSRREGLARIALLEALGNVALSVGLGLALGFRGVALASLITVMGTNGWLIPRMLFPRIGLSWLRDLAIPVAIDALVTLPAGLVVVAALPANEPRGWELLLVAAALLVVYLALLTVTTAAGTYRARRTNTEPSGRPGSIRSP